jgi:Ser/Thr protein kinase RdoA (MazF antagonist)
MTMESGAPKDADGPDTDGPDTDGPDTDGPDADNPDTDGADAGEDRNGEDIDNRPFAVTLARRPRRAKPARLRECILPNDPTIPAPAALAAILARHPATAALAARWRAEDVVPMREKGVAHAHYRLPQGLVLRAPRLSQWALAPADNLAYQAACFRRAEQSGATPRLFSVLPVGADLPRGALIVEAIDGRPPRLPDDLPALAAALARLHALDVPAPAHRPPLVDHARFGPIAGTLAVIERQAPALEAADLPGATRGALLAELAWARQLAADSAATDQPICLVGTDTHPGNFVLRENGEAVLVDLEKALYGSPAIDLAHCTLPTSTTWDLDVQAVLSRDQIIGFYRHYLELVGTRQAARLRPLLAPSRRLTWLRTMMWCARWRVAAATSPDWSQARVDPVLLAHIRRRVAALFDPDFVAAMRAEWLAGPPLEF